MFRPWENCTAVTLRDVPVDVDDNDGHEVCDSKHRQHLSMDAKQIVLNVYNGLMEIDELSTSKAIQIKTSQLTKIPESTVRKMVTVGVCGRKKRCDSGQSRKVTLREVDIVRQNICSFYRKNEVVTVATLREALISDDIEYSKSTLRRLLIANGFKYQKIDRRQCIMESSRIRKWRYDYLLDIDRYRQQGKTIYYLDETWYDTHDIVKKGWNDNSDQCQLDVPASRGKRLIILHCGSTNGWVEEAAFLSAKNIKKCSLDYHEDMSASIFEDWFENCLIPKLSENSAIVLDNAPYHSRLQKKIPNSSSNKETIQEFLYESNIFFENSYTKKQLLECIKSFEFSKEYVVDTIARKHNHDVLRLPPYHCIFNPIELIWAQLKENVRRKNTSPKFSENVVKLIKEEIGNISANLWRSAIDHVRKIETKYNDLPTMHPELIINVNIDEDSTESDFEDDTDIFI